MDLILLISQAVFASYLGWTFVINFDAQTIAAILSLIVAVVACILSYTAFKSQEVLSQEQLNLVEQGEKRDEFRHFQRIDAEATKFLQRNQEERYLIPLCAVAFQYDKSKSYRRSIYRDYCTLPEDVRKQIFIREGINIHLPVAEGDELFGLVLNRVESFVPKDDKDVFYDNGKYFSRAIEYYGESPLFNKNPLYTDLISNAFSGNAPDDVNPVKLVDYLAGRYGFSQMKEHEACQFVTNLAWLMVFYEGDEPASVNYGSPENFLCSHQTYMEDLFLYAVYEICLYTNWK